MEKEESKAKQSHEGKNKVQVWTIQLIYNGLETVKQSINSSECCSGKPEVALQAERSDKVQSFLYDR